MSFGGALALFLLAVAVALYAIFSVSRTLVAYSPRLFRASPPGVFFYDGVIMFVTVAWLPKAVWPYVLGTIALVSLVTWTSYYRHARWMRDLPTSRVASAAQGYVELFGRAEPHGEPVVSPYGREPCCWCQFRRDEKDADNKWQLVDGGHLPETFLLVDETGACVISPRGADVLSRHYNEWNEGRVRYREWLIPQGADVYALGELVTLSEEPPPPRGEWTYVSALLNVWKKDPKTLKERWDTNRDGTIDLDEWAAARKDAQRVVRERGIPPPPAIAEGQLTLRKPSDERLFVIADTNPGKRIAWRYYLRGFGHLVFFFAAGTLAVGLLVWRNPS